MKKNLCMLLVLMITVSVLFGCKENPPATDDTASLPSMSMEGIGTTSATETNTADPSTETTAPETTAGSTTPPLTETPTTPPTEAPTTPPTTQVPPPPPVTDASKPTEGQNEQNNPAVVAGGKWVGGPVTWKITSDGVLTISGQTDIQGKQTYDWKDYADIVTRIVIEDGITSIPTYAFSEMKNVTSVYLGNTVKLIEYCAFEHCSALASITIPASLETMGKNVFYGCLQMTSLNFAEGCNLQVIDQYAFAKTAIQEFATPDNLQTIEFYAFAECADLESVRLDGSISTVKAYAFRNCKSLKYVYFGESVIYSVPSVFEKCTAITTVDDYGPRCHGFTEHPNLTTVVIGGEKTDIGGYRQCPLLSSVTILSPATKINGGAFEDCTSLTTLTIPDTVTIIGASAFRRSGLTSITIPASVAEIGLAAFMDTPLQEITFMGDAPTIVNNIAFTNVTATVYYPAENKTWTEETRQNYGGTLTWVPY